MRFLCVFAVSLLFSSCSDNSTGPGFDLSEGELNYYVSGGWIQGYHLEIEQDGLATAFGSYNDSDTLGFLKLSRQDIRELEAVMSRFEMYDGFYEPEIFYTDQNTHTIVADFGGSKDTVAVYMPDEAPIPASLKSLIDRLEDIWARAAGLKDK